MAARTPSTQNNSAPATHISRSQEKEIQQRLAAAEREHQVTVLLAVESGSRAWGFPSPDSDYDVRFVYAHPTEWYLSVDLEQKRDVIEYPILDEIDLAGWDLRKTLQLLRKSNPGIIEWLHSPITYRDDKQFRSHALELLPDLFRPQSGIHHYRRMAEKHYRQHLTRQRVALKKYLYALRPLLAAQWIQHHQEPAPLAFHTLLTLIDSQPVLETIHQLLDRKANSREMADTKPSQLLNRFIEEGLIQLEQVTTGRPTSAEAESVNHLFQTMLRQSVDIASASMSLITR